MGSGGGGEETACIWGSFCLDKGIEGEQFGIWNLSRFNPSQQWRTRQPLTDRTHLCCLQPGPKSQLPDLQGGVCAQVPYSVQALLPSKGTYFS